MNKLERYNLQSRMLEVKKKLPESALAVFFDKYPEYKNEREYIYSVYNLRAVDTLITEKFENLLS